MLNRLWLHSDIPWLLLPMLFKTELIVMACTKVYCLLEVHILVTDIPIHGVSQAIPSHFSFLPLIYPSNAATSCQFSVDYLPAHVGLFSISRAAVLVLNFIIFHMAVCKKCHNEPLCYRLPDSSSNLITSFPLVEFQRFSRPRHSFTIDMNLYLSSCLSYCLYSMGKSL